MGQIHIIQVYLKPYDIYMGQAFIGLPRPRRRPRPSRPRRRPPRRRPRTPRGRQNITL